MDSNQNKHIILYRLNSSTKQTEFIYQTNHHTRKIELKVKPNSRIYIPEEKQSDVYEDFLYCKDNSYGELARKHNLNQHQIAKIINSKLAEKKI